MSDSKGKPVERPVVFMIDPTAQYISIVDRGANQTPFKIVKHETRGENRMKILQKLIVPKGADLEAVKASMPEETRDLLNLEQGAEYGDRIFFEQQPAETCKAGTFEIVSLDEETGVQAVQAELSEKAESGFLPKLFKKPVETKKSVIQLDGMEQVSVATMKGQLTHDAEMEMYKAMDGVAAILAQDKGDKAAKMQAIQVVMGNFSSFLGELLDVAKGDIQVDVVRAFSAKEDAAEETSKSEEEPVKESPEEEPKEEATEEAVKEEAAKSDESADSESSELQELKAYFQEQIESLKSELKTSKEAVSEVTGKLEEAKETISKMGDRIPGALEDLESDEIPEKETTQKTDADVFAGIFG